MELYLKLIFKNIKILKVFDIIEVYEKYYNKKDGLVAEKGNMRVCLSAKDKLFDKIVSIEYRREFELENI